MGIIFCLCLFVTLLPTAALAAKKPTKVMVGGTNVVTDSTSYWRSNGSGGIEAGSAADYTVMFTPATNEHTAILTLNEADINGGSGTGDEDSAIYFIGAPLEIHLIGDSYVTKNDGGAWRSAIKAYGHLTITAENKNCSAEITAEGGGLTYQSSSIRNAGRTNSTTATEHSAPRAIRLHIDEIMSMLEYRPTPKVAAKKPRPLTSIDCAEEATA